MIEFITSRFWTVLFGLVMISIIVSSFSAIKGQNESVQAQSCADGISDLTYGLEVSPYDTTATVDTSSIVGLDNAYIEISNGSVWIQWSGGKVASPLPEALVLKDKSGGIRSNLTIGSQDVLFLRTIGSDRTRMIQIQLEN